MTKARLFASLLLSLGVLSSCESSSVDDGFGPNGGKSDSPFGIDDLIEGTAPAIGLLRFVNDEMTTFKVLNEDAHLRSDAAQNLIDHRDGGDERDLFDDVDELDDVPRIGLATLRDLLDFAFDNGFIPQGDELLGTYDNVEFSVTEANAVIALVNRSNEVELDDDIALDGRAVQAILDARPLASILVLSELSFVGRSALEKLKDNIPLPETEREIGILSDLDKTIVPPAPSGQDLPDDAYAGIAELLNILEFGDGTNAAGDINFVTARQPESVTEIPTWLAEHGVPLGPISTGISGIPFLARDEKIRDISAVFEANVDQRFVMFGDSSHVDPDAYRTIIETFGEQVEVAFIHNVKTIDESRLVGLILIDNYAQAAAELFRIGRISEDEARMVMEAVVLGGEIDRQELEELIASHRSN